MCWDQQFPLERAFAAPYVLTQRLGRPLDVGELASFDPEALSAIFATPPALHRFPVSMAKRVQALCQVLVEKYEGDPTTMWSTAADGKELLKRIGALPGFGAQKGEDFRRAARQAARRDPAGLA